MTPPRTHPSPNKGDPDEGTELDGIPVENPSGKPLLPEHARS